METECYEEEFQYYRKTDYKPIIPGISTGVGKNGNGKNGNGKNGNGNKGNGKNGDIFVFVIINILPNYLYYKKKYDGV